MIYHVLPEGEPFSDHFGGALSRWVANVIYLEDSARIVCPWTDGTWRFPAEMICPLLALRSYGKLRKLVRRELPMGIRLKVIRWIFKELLQNLKPQDIVYVHNRPDFALALAGDCRRRRAKLLLHMQNSHLVDLPAQHRARIDVDAVTFCSDFLKREAQPFLSAIPLQFVVPNGADDSVFYPSQQKVESRSSPVVLFVGRLVPEKGVHIFMDAMRILKNRNVSVSGKIVGSVRFGSNNSSRYVVKLKKMRPENVRFADYASGEDLANEYRTSDIFCCPSVWNEAFGMVNVEAMATCLPVVACRVGGIPEIFETGGAILVDTGSATQIADAIEMLVNQPKTKSAIAQLGYAAFQTRFTWNQIRQRYLVSLSTLSGTLQVPDQ